MKRLERLFDRLCDLCAALAGAIVLGMLVVVSADIFLRYAFSRPLSWGVAFTEYGLLYMVFLGAGWLQREHGHVSVDLLTGSLPSALSRPLARITALVGAGSFALLAWYGWQVTRNQFMRGSVTPDLLSVPQYLITMVIPFGALLLALVFLRQAWNSDWKPAGKEDLAS